MFDADATGAATGQHRCIAGSVPASVVAAANAGATHWGGTCGAATWPDVQAAIASGQLSHGMPTGASASGTNAANVGAVNSAADAMLADSAIDVQAVYDMLGELDEQAEAKREPMHAPIVTVYAPNAPNTDSGDAMTIDGISAYTPAIDRDYLIDSSQLAAIQRLINRIDRSGRPANIGLYGEPGSGKTTLGVQIAAMRRGPVVVCEASAWQTPDEVYATTTGIDRESGAVQARASRFVMGIETPGATVVINDVANLQNPRVQNGLNELLDPSTRATFVEALGRAVRVAPGVVIIGTWNTNTISATELSGQILDRFASGLMFEVPLPTNGALAHILTARTGINRPGAQRLARGEWLRNDAVRFPLQHGDSSQRRRSSRRGQHRTRIAYDLRRA